MNDSVYIIGVSQFNTSRLNKISPPLSQLQLISRLLNESLVDASSNISTLDLNGFISMHPEHTDESLKSASYPYYSQWIATKLNLYKPINKPFITKHYTSGGATPISQCLEAKCLINTNKNIECIATMIVQTPNSIDRKKLVSAGIDEYKSQLTELNLMGADVVPIPALYSAHTDAFLEYAKKYDFKRKHLAMIPVLMYRNGYYNKLALSYKNDKLLNATFDTVLNSKNVGGCSSIKQYECARLSDGGFCLIIANKQFILKHKINMNKCFKILGGAEFDQSFRHKLYLQTANNYNLNSYSIFHSVKQCYINSKCSVNDIAWFGLYDCFPIVFIFGLLSCGLCTIENMVEFVEKLYYNKSTSLPIPINSHGGLLALGAPTMVPSGFSIVECIKQLRGESNGVQIDFGTNNKKLKGLIVGNGGILQQSSAMIIEKQHCTVSKL